MSRGLGNGNGWLLFEPGRQLGQGLLLFESGRGCMGGGGIVGKGGCSLSLADVQ